MLVYSLLAGLLFGLYFSLIGLGLNLVFGVMRIVNLAHGDFLMLGAFLAFWLFTLFALNPVAAVVVAFVVFMLVGLPLYYLAGAAAAARQGPGNAVVHSVLRPLAGDRGGDDDRLRHQRALDPRRPAWARRRRGRKLLCRPPGRTGPVELFGQTFPAAWVASSIASGGAVLLVYLYLYQTRLGYLTRAVMDNRDEAIATGIDVHRVSAIAFGIGIGLAAVAGVFAPFMLGSITPAMGAEVTITAFAVIVIGSLGNPLGTVLGGIIYGISYMLMQSYYSSWANLLPYVLLIAILLVRPSGLLGRRVRRA